ncbi:SDR family oxidoreductase [Streptomyces sp. AD2-2]|nr:SDR family oxidoreductase [Streptomyces sp. AD2-2]
MSPGVIGTPQRRQEASAQPAMTALVEQTPLGRVGRAEDVAAAVAFLLSGEAAFVSGRFRNRRSRRRWGLCGGTRTIRSLTGRRPTEEARPGAARRFLSGGVRCGVRTSRFPVPPNARRGTRVRAA